MSEEEIQIDWSQVNIQWHGPRPDIQDVERLVLEDCAISLDGLDRVSELIFHHVPLEKSWDHNVVVAWGEEDSEDLHCEFMPTVTWTNMKHE